jgi:hypothetical protein
VAGTQEKTAKQVWASQSELSKFLAVGGAIALVIFVLIGLGTGFKSTSSIQACWDAQNARSLSESASFSDQDRQIAAMQYAVKKAECESQGGSVP